MTFADSKVAGCDLLEGAGTGAGIYTASYGPHTISTCQHSVTMTMTPKLALGLTVYPLQLANTSPGQNNMLFDKP